MQLGFVLQFKYETNIIFNCGYFINWYKLLENEIELNS